jgi:transposase InsO family protein
MSYFDQDCLRRLAFRITSGDITLTAVCAEVLDAHGRPRPISRTALIQAFDRFGIEHPHFTRGRPATSVPPALLDEIRARYDRFPMGATRMFMSLQDPPVRARLGRITSPMVEHAYDALNLWRYHLPDEVPEPPRCRYEACQANLIWHTDLHQPHDAPGYMIAFLDDASRRIMGIEHLEHKSADQTAAALIRALNFHQAPYAIWSDNGTEFRAEFDTVLARLHICHLRTTPYNPQQNGKMERFWPTLERCPPGVPLFQYINSYNQAVHTALPRNPDIQDVFVPQTPDQAYQSLPRWTPGVAPMWRINGVVRPFNPGTAPSDTAE